MIMRKTILGTSILFIMMACGETKPVVTTEEAEVKSEEFVKDEKPPFEMTKEHIKKTFLAYLPNISNKRTLNEDHPAMENGMIIKLGDIDGDSLVDAIVDYSLNSTFEETRGEQNTGGEISGVVVFKNMGDGIQVIYQTQEIGKGDLLKIEQGTILFKALDYAESDPRCCPSIEYEIQYYWDEQTNKLEEIQGC